MSSPENKNDLGFSRFLTRAGLTEDDCYEIMRELSPPVPNELVDASFRLGTSLIHGLGMFSVRRVCGGEVFPVCCGGVG
jgi:hypothetical protein